MVVKSAAEQSDETYHISYILHKAVLHKYPEFTDYFAAGDAIEITGCTSHEENNGSHIIRSISGRTLTFDNDIFSGTGAEGGTVSLARNVPDLTCICECDNRIWGAEGTTIYASALGDPKNFYLYDGLSTDAYAVAVGTDGEFTGCIAYSSTVLFWKEDCVHKVIGSTPSTYEIYTYTVPGVQAGSEKSLVVINETLFYKGQQRRLCLHGRHAGSSSARTSGRAGFPMPPRAATASDTISPCRERATRGSSTCSTRCGACGCGRTTPTPWTLRSWTVRSTTWTRIPER